jgi:hypothetical protein
MIIYISFKSGFYPTQHSFRKQNSTSASSAIYLILSDFWGVLKK